MFVKRIQCSGLDNDGEAHGPGTLNFQKTGTFQVYLNTVLGRHLFSIANDCFVNLSNLSKLLAKKQMKYFDVSLDHAWKVSILHYHCNYYHHY